MDNLTHSLAGAVLADAGLARRSAYGTTALVVGANLPDVDGVTMLIGADVALAWRRGVTHGVVAMVVLPLVLTAALVAYDRMRRWPRSSGPRLRPGWLFALSCLGVWSHPALDWLNNYGVRLLMPFSGRWFYGDSVFIVDPWLWLLLGGVVFLRHSKSPHAVAGWALLAAVTSALVLAGASGYPAAQVAWGLGIVALAALRRRRGPLGERAAPVAALALAAALGYIGALRVETVRAERLLAAELPALGVEGVEKLMAGPVPVVPWRRLVVVQTAGEYRFGSYDPLARPRFELDARRIPRPGDEPAARAALAAPCLRGMVAWARFPWVEVDARGVEAGGGAVVYVMDARYSRSRGRGFGGAAVVLDAELEPRCDAEP